MSKKAPRPQPHLGYIYDRYISGDEEGALAVCWRSGRGLAGPHLSRGFGGGAFQCLSTTRQTAPRLLSLLIVLLRYCKRLHEGPVGQAGGEFANCLMLWCRRRHQQSQSVFSLECVCCSSGLMCLRTRTVPCPREHIFTFPSLTPLMAAASGRVAAWQQTAVDILVARAPHGGRRRPRGSRKLPRQRARPARPPSRYCCPIKAE